jgi:hypothetical protein
MPCTISRTTMLLLALASVFALAGVLPNFKASAADWLTAPSYFTHDRTTGQRVAQYSPVGPFYYYTRPDFLRSGYRHYRSTIDLGNSSDNLHVVEQWGVPVVPYEQWRFPFRPYGVPYPAWGPPFGGLGGGGMYPYGGPGGFPGFGVPFPGWWGGGWPGGPPVNFAQPWLDGHYPSYDFNDRSDYWRPYVAPPTLPPGGFPPATPGGWPPVTPPGP